MINLTQSALTQLKAEFAKRSVPDLYLRVGVRSGGCNGFTYVLEFSNAPKKSNDIELDFEDVKIVVDPKSLTILKGTTLDYESSLMHRGFKFSNPNSKGECGCGKSFRTE